MHVKKPQHEEYKQVQSNVEEPKGENDWFHNSFFMLPVAYRLRKKTDFNHVYQQGKIIHSSFFRISVAKNTLPRSRFGIIVLNKYMKKAVERNKKKRQIRAILSALYNTIVPGYDIVLFARKECVHASYQKMFEDVQSGLERAKLLSRQ